MRAHGIEVQRTKLVITTVKTVRRRDGFLTATFFSEMTGKKKNTVYRRKRKGDPSLQFRYSRKK